MKFGFHKKSVLQRALFFVLCFLAATVQADVLILKNGDRLTGTVLNETAGVLKFKTSYAGELSIKWEEIKEVRSDKPMLLLMDKHQSLQANIIKNQGETLLMKHDGQDAAIEVVKEFVEQINPVAWRLGKGYDVSGMINFSFEYDRGNNDNDEIDLDGNLVYRRLHHRLRLFGEYEKNRSDHITTKLKWTATASYDYFPRKDWTLGLDTADWYVGLGLNLKKDEFADLNLRTRVGPHVGYQFYESKPINLFVQGGIGVVNEQFVDSEDNLYWATAGRLKFDKYLYKDWLQFYLYSDALYGFSSPNKVILDNWAGFRFPLRSGFVTSIEVETNYDSQPAEKKDKLDASYRFKLGYEF